MGDRKIPVYARKHSYLLSTTSKVFIFYAASFLREEFFIESRGSEMGSWGHEPEKGKL